MKKKIHRHIYNFTILVLLIYIITACSNTRLIYTFIDNFIQDEVSYFLDLNKEEELFSNHQISEMVSWHRTSMLPSYAIYLREIANKIENKQILDTDVSDMLADGRLLIEKTVIGLTPFASKLIIRHQTLESIKFMEKKMVARQKERLEEFSKPKNIRYKKRLKRLTSNFNRFVGKLNAEQIILVEAHASATLNDSRVRFQNRTLRQREFVKFLKTQPNETELTTYLNRLLLRGHEIANPNYKKFSEASLDRFGELLVKIFATSSNTQQKTIVSNLRKYAEDFKIVSE